jgi:hypothetical protein
MWFYPGPSCLDHPFSEEFGDVQINTRIHKVLAYRADFNPGVSPTPMRDGVNSTRVSPFALAFGSLHNLIHPLRSCPFVGSHVSSQHAMGGGVTLPEDAGQ